MKLSSEALKPVFEEVKKLSEDDPTTTEDGKAIAVGLIEIYLKNLGASDYKTAVMNLTNARSGMSAIIDTGLKGRALVTSLRNEHNAQLVDAFVHYLNLMLITAEAHHHGHLN